MKGRPLVLFESFLPGSDGRSFRFEGLEQVLVAERPEQVPMVLEAVERAVVDGLHAAGFVSYEAAPGFDPALSTHFRGLLPPAWFGIFTERIPVEAGSTTAAGACRWSIPESSWDEKTYTKAFHTVKEYIAAGDSYQINLTFRQSFRFAGDPFAFYRRLCTAQPTAFCAWLDLGDQVIASASPELFFARRGEEIIMRPMKGTAPRSLDQATDQRHREQLVASAKERAENLMIVDLVRNDLGRFAVTGSVRVPELFTVESYPTLHQMTSTVAARLGADTVLNDIFRALFPCGSVTGAPKRRSMEIIRELEEWPRDLYCGALGFVSPGGDAVFSVAIRTAILDLTRGRGELGIGSGVTTDADAAAEYRECLDKSRFLTRGAEPLRLVETLLWQSDRGYVLLNRHLGRLTASAATLGFTCDPDKVVRRLRSVVPEGNGRYKVRLLLAEDGTIDVTVVPLASAKNGPVSREVMLTATPIDAREPLLRHKTTWRPWYDGVLDQYPGCCDVLFCNTHDEVTEGTIHNLVVEWDGRLLTPPVTCGLLPGTLRQELLARGILREAVIRREELLSARRIWLINSVRGWRFVTLNKQEEEIEHR